jgi:hypothetical protein
VCRPNWSLPLPRAIIIPDVMTLKTLADVRITFVALAASTKAILAYRTGKRDSENTDLFIRDLRERVLGTPEISTDGFHPYCPAIRDAFGTRVAHGVINKTYSVTDLRKDAAHR